MVGLYQPLKQETFFFGTDRTVGLGLNAHTIAPLIFGIVKLLICALYPQFARAAYPLQCIRAANADGQCDRLAGCPDQRIVLDGLANAVGNVFSVSRLARW